MKDDKLWRVCLVFWICGWAHLLHGIISIISLGLWRNHLPLTVAKWTNRHIYLD